MRVSIRAKLTLWYAAIVGAVLLGLGTAVYLGITRSYLTQVDRSLLFYARSVARNAAGAAEPPATETPMEESWLPVFPAEYVQLLDENGIVVQDLSEDTPAKTAVPLGHWREAAQQSAPVFETARSSDGRALRLVTLAHRSPDGATDFFVTVGQRLDDLSRLQEQIAWGLGIGIPATFLCLSLGGWLLVSRVLAPVDRITRAVQRIGEGNLYERVETPGADDELNRLARTFNHMLERVEQAFERQRQFTADASHELRTPLALMRGELELALRRPRTAEEYIQALESTLEETNRLSALVDGLLTLARSDSGEIAFESAPVAVGDLCREVCGDLAPVAESRRVSLTVDPADDLPVVTGDAPQLRRLLLNLLDNALKYTPSGGSVSVSARSEGGDRVVIDVIDSGPGVPESDRERIFERFYRRRNSGSAGGFGLGLSIARWIARMHGGTLVHVSPPRPGSIFRLTLPTKQRSGDR